MERKRPAETNPSNTEGEEALFIIGENGRKRLTRAGKRKAFEIFTNIYESIEDKNHPREKIEEILSTNPQYQIDKDLMPLIALSIERRVIRQYLFEKYNKLERKNEWNETLDVIREKLYPPELYPPEMKQGFFDNFSIPWAVKTREKLERSVSEITRNDPSIQPEELLSRCEEELIKRLKKTAGEIDASELPKRGKLPYLLEKAIGDFDKFVKEIVQHPKKPEDRENEFKQRIRNALSKAARVGVVLAFIGGAAYGIYEDIRNKGQQQTLQALTPPTPITQNILQTPTLATPNNVYYTTPFPTFTPTPTADRHNVATPESKETPTPIPVEREEERFVIRNGDKISITLDKLDFSFEAYNLKRALELKPTGLVRQEMKSYQGELPKGAFLDGEKGIFILVDSGYLGQKPLGAEEERKKIQGGDIDPSVPLKSDEEINTYLQGLIGKKAIIERGGEKDEKKTLQVIAAVRVPHHLVERFSKSTEEAFEVLLELTGGELSPLKDLTTNKKGIFYVFCLWGPVDENGLVRRGVDGWFAWERAVLVFVEAGEDRSPHQIYP